QEQRLNYLKIALNVIGVIFIVGVPAMMMWIWPSGWGWTNGIRLRNIVIRLRIYKNPPGIATMAEIFCKSQACALHPRHLLSGFIDFLV
ncbi:MAG: hypothetical protein KAI44_04490, partial [Methylococcales bacterium]|nr:hypothetical protein [Methylococcales bacterium]